MNCPSLEGHFSVLFPCFLLTVLYCQIMYIIVSIYDILLFISIKH